MGGQKKIAISGKKVKVYVKPGDDVPAAFAIDLMETAPDRTDIAHTYSSKR